MFESSKSLLRTSPPGKELLPISVHYFLTQSQGNSFSVLGEKEQWLYIETLVESNCEYIVKQVTRPVCWTTYCIVLFFFYATFWKTLWKGVNVNGLVVKVLDSQSQDSRIQNHSVAPRSIQPFILGRSMKRVPEISGNVECYKVNWLLIVTVALRQLSPIHKKEP